ncbi:hypothetical protein HCJ76_00740 [Streptomyces sp. MC1]|uniref:hypothetical protein n=1 Tax=Streptomyces sp. MC1 TaxID=295105 RepID=UPI0018C9B77B|nr:hypothetical protein [Streptomyces sp. MC1]MBG7696658.1 hypothetical protein [Streptomyces sp. MC1]
MDNTRQSTDVLADSERLARTAADYFREHKLVVVASRVRLIEWLLDFFDEYELPPPLLVLGDATGAPIPDRAFQLQIPGNSVAQWRRNLEEQLLAPDAGLVALLDAYDPQRQAVVFTPPLNHGHKELLKRRCIAWRRPQWAQYEDKVVSDAFWQRAGVTGLRSVITDLSLAGLGQAFEECDEGHGVVVSGDSSYGVLSGGTGVARARTTAELPNVLEFLEGRCRQVRVSPFVEGIACTTHGMVLQKETAVYRPVEGINLRESGTRFPFTGCSTYWTPPERESEFIREIVRKVGDRLREEAGYLGSYGVDGIVTEHGFRPTEINARMGGFIVNGGPAEGVPLDLVNAMVMEGEESGIDAAALERTMIDGFRRIDLIKLFLPAQPDFPGGAVQDVALHYTSGSYVVSGADEPADVHVRRITTPVGATLVLEFPDRPFYRNRTLGNFAVSALKSASRIMGITLPDYSYPQDISPRGTGE